jgi:B12-binding domain/radical SAM domain protein
LRLFAKPDLVLLHPPSVYDFREILSVPGPIADLIPSGTSFEMYPIGFSFLGEYLERHGINVRVVNLAARMLSSPGFDAGRFLARLRPVAFGVSFHWLPHAHGSLEVARLCKRLHPEVPVIMGGYSATLFSRELMESPEVDFVVRGDSTEEPLRLLMGHLAGGGGALEAIPNLTFRDPASGAIKENELKYVPGDLEHLGDNYVYMLRSAVKYGDIRGLRAFRDWWSYPLTAVTTCRGCLNDCGFCGGSAYAMNRRFCRRGAAFRRPEAIARDVETISRFTGAPIFVVGDLRQNGDEHARRVFELLGAMSPRNHIVLELFEPAPKWFFERAAESLPNFDIEISPESHDETIRDHAGKAYSNRELEESIGWALEAGAGKVDVFFMIGLPGQTPGSVSRTVAYCSDLLRRFGARVNPLISPLAPFLDPGSIFFDRAEEKGYTLLFQSLEDYRSAVLKPHWRDMLSYETASMSRRQIVDSTYQALLELNRAKLETGRVTQGYAARVERFLLDTTSLLERLDAAVAVEDASARTAELAIIKREAGSLEERSGILKEELAWPIEGRRFRFLSILRLLLGRP